MLGGEGEGEVVSINHACLECDKGYTPRKGDHFCGGDSDTESCIASCAYAYGDSRDGCVGRGVGEDFFEEEG